jgi:hypothetical protein
MALIQYPQTDWNTFLSEAEALSWMEHQRDDGGYSNLTVDQQELLLIQTASQIRLCKNIVLPDDNEADLKEGQAYLLLQATRVDMTQYDHNGKFVTKEKVGSLEVDYSGYGRNTEVSDFPPMAKLFLTQYGCTGSVGFSQSNTVKA